MDEILSYFGLVAELSVGIIAFQVIAVSFALTKKIIGIILIMGDSLH